MGEMMRWDIINKLIEENNYKSYLEIGYYKGWSFDRVNAQFKMAVDPNPCKMPYMKGWMSHPELGYSYEEGEYSLLHRDRPREVIVKSTSDDFFSKLPEDTLFDIIFIDGLHEHTQVDRDISNALRHLSKEGRIVLHDTNPPTYLHTTRGLDGCWTGDVYIAACRRLSSGVLTGYTVNTDWGVTVFQAETCVDNRILQDDGIEWTRFDAEREQLLNLISPQDFLNKFDNGQTDYNI